MNSAVDWHDVPVDFLLGVCAVFAWDHGEMPRFLLLALLIFHLWELEHSVERAVVRGKDVVTGVLSCWLDMILRSINVDAASALDLSVESACLWLASHESSEAFLSVSTCAGTILENIGLASSVKNLIGNLVALEGIERRDLYQIICTRHNDKLVLVVAIGSRVWGDTDSNDFNVSRVEFLVVFGICRKLC